MNEKPTIKHPHWRFTMKLPMVRNQHIKRPIFIGRFGLGFFGPSPATNRTWTLYVFGWVVCELKKLEWHDESDKERADRYLSEWSKCEKELQMFRLARLGEDAAPEVKKVIRESLGVDLDEGTIR